MNGHYIRESHIERIYQMCLEYLWDNDAISETFMRESGSALKRMIQSVQSSLKTIADVGDQITYFLGEVHSYDPVGVAKHLNDRSLPILEEAMQVLEETVVFNEMTLEERFRAEAVTRGRKFADYVHPMRLAITGRTVSPNLFELIEILGKGRCLVRLKRFVLLIKAASGNAPVDPVT